MSTKEKRRAPRGDILKDMTEEKLRSKTVTNRQASLANFGFTADNMEVLAKYKCDLGTCSKKFHTQRALDTHKMKGHPNV